MKKRSVNVSGHATSITLEDEFWDALAAIAAAKGVSVSALITQIDQDRSTKNLSSAIRIFVLKSLQQKITVEYPSGHP